MSVTATENTSPFEEHCEDSAWEAGYQHGIWLGVILTDRPTEHDEKIEAVEAQGALWAATGACMVCGSSAALEFQPRKSGRSSIWLCRHDLARFLQVFPPFPDGDPDPIDPLAGDQPMWFAGLMTGIAVFAPMAPLPPAGDAEAQRTFWNRLAWKVKRETCSLCPGAMNTWVGSSAILSVRLCGLCKAHVREQLALVEWRQSGQRATEPE